MKELQVDTKVACIVSDEDYDLFKSKKLRSSFGKYVTVWDEDKNKWVMLHHLVIGKPSKGMVVDHINGNRYDNRRDNLRFATVSQNNQNVRRNVENGGYVGVYYTEAKNHWRAFCKGMYLGSYKSDIEAAKQYDKAAYTIFGEFAKTNNTVNYDEVKDMYKIDDLICKPLRDLPKNICYRWNTYYVKFEFEGNIYQQYSIETLEEAKDVLQTFKNNIYDIQQKRKQIHNEKHIERNGDGYAVIKNKEYHILVDDDLWHEYSAKFWHISNGYAKTNVDDTTIFMHRMVMNATDDDMIDHINKNRLDNRRCNLRIAKHDENNHNRTKKRNASSKYYGVNKNGNRWCGRFRYQGKTIYCGTFATELEAAKAYNAKATEYYGEYANINQF